MSPELTKVLEELRGVTNNFRLRGNGVSGNLVEGFSIRAETSGGLAVGGAPAPGCCDVSLFSGITFVTLGLDLSSECCACTPDCSFYQRITGRTWTVTTSDPPEVDRFLFLCFETESGTVIDFKATSHAFGTDITGRGIIVETDDTDTYWINADIGYLTYSPFPPDNCNKIAVAPYATIAFFGFCEDTGSITFPPEIGATYTAAELIGSHTFSQDAECPTHPGKFWHAIWSITFA